MNYYELRNRHACHRAAAFQLALPGGGVPLFLAFASSNLEFAVFGIWFCRSLSQSSLVCGVDDK